MTGQGLVLDTFQLQDIQAEGSYLADLGRPEAARVVKEAAIAEARARQASEQEQLLAEEAIAISNRQLALKQAEISAEIDAAKAQAAAAGPLAQAAQDQLVLIQQEKVASLADAEAIEGAKKGEAERLRRQSIAEAVEREGTADASAILARGKAEAEAMDQRSQAFSTYGEAAVLDLLVKVLPEIVKAAAAPLASVDKITMIHDTSDGNAGILVEDGGQQCRTGPAAHQRSDRCRPGGDAVPARRQQRAGDRRRGAGRWPGHQRLCRPRPAADRRRRRE